MADTARAAAAFGVTQVNGFTGSSIWHMLYSFPPNDWAEIDRGYEDFAERWLPVLEVFEMEGVRFGLEVHPAEFVAEFADRIYHVHVKDSKRRLDGRRSILGSHVDFGDRARGWDFVSPGHGDVDFEEMIRALNRIGYEGPLSVEWEDSGMDRQWGAQDAVAFVRRIDFAPSAVAFDQQFKADVS